jgi:hypothetical protein
VCRSEEYGGLGVRQMREFNSALLGKWCWRMLVDRSGFSFSVWRVDGEGAAGGRGVSSWWKAIARLRDGSGEGEERGWFAEG